MPSRRATRRPIFSAVAPAATWAVVLGLVSGCGSDVTGAQGGTGGGGGDGSGGEHPCDELGLGTCDSYMVLPDGTAERVPPDGVVPPGAELRICGACNG